MEAEYATPYRFSADASTHLLRSIHLLVAPAPLALLAHLAHLAHRLILVPPAVQEDPEAPEALADLGHPDSDRWASVLLPGLAPERLEVPP